ncbi:MAG: translocation/assembly module TamB domain-containing protein [Bacteroidetes bacterium]|nr:translocation/assembly module TamB domain-containing protein [Bacteroidota bacterium]HET6245118.1 translocation/assembly module TamB domain-containing protein [Bacteroidia bacterium]
MLTILSFAIRDSRAQSWLASKAALWISAKTGTVATVRGVDIEFFKTIVLEGLYLEDLDKDTLLYTDKIKIDIGLLSFQKNKISFSSIILDQAEINIKFKQGEDHINFQFLLDAFQSNDTSSMQAWDIDVSSLELVNSKFSYQDKNMPVQDFGVNYWDIKAENINLKLADIRFKGDTILAEIQNISLKEKSGFILNGLSAMASICSSELIMENLFIHTPESEVKTFLSFKYDHWVDWKDFITNVNMKYNVQKAVVNFSDVSYFAPYLRGIDKKVELTGEVRGTVDHLKGRNLRILTGELTSFKGDVNINGLPEIDETYWHLNIQQFITNKKDLDNIPLPPFDTGTRLKTNDNINLLGNMRFQGDFSGFFNDFVAYGDFTTALGKLSSDISLSFDSITNKPYYKGSLSTQSFNLGKFLDIKELGSISLSTKVKGSGITKDEIKGDLTGTINRIELNRYHYKNIDFKGSIAQELFNGSLVVDDENLDMSFDGSIDFNGILPEFLFTTSIRSARLANLNLINRDTSSNITSNIVFNLKGNSLDNMIGTIDVNNTYYSEMDLSYFINKISLNSHSDNGDKVLNLKSDLAEINLQGIFSIEYMYASILDVFDNIISSDIKAPQLRVPGNKIQQFTYDINLKDIQPITELFLPEFEIGKNTKLYGSFESEKNSLKLKGHSSQINLYGIELKHFFINSNIENDIFVLNLGCAETFLSDSITLKNFMIDTRTKKELMVYEVKWDNLSEIKNKASITGSVLFNSLSKFELQLNPSEIFISDSLWIASSQSPLYFDSTSIKIQDLLFSTGSQDIEINGTLTNNADDKLQLRFMEFNLANLNVLTSPSGIELAGFIDGIAFVSDIYNNVLFGSKLSLKKLSVNKENIGDGVISSTWNTQNQSIVLDGHFLRGSIPTFEISGNYFPYKKKNNIDLVVKLEKLQLQMVDQYLEEWVSDLRGLATGKVTINGEITKPLIQGKINLQKAGCLIKYLNTHYTFSHEISIENNKIFFENLSLFDSRGNKAISNGSLSHSNFEKLEFNLTLLPENFMVLNTQEIHNPLYYGTAFVTGKVDINGPVENLNIDITAKSEKGTVFYIPLTGSEELTVSNFITFINKDTTIVKVKDEYKVDLSGIKMNFEFELTPDAEVQIIFDPKIGDVIKGKGKGNLTMEINTLGKFSIFGEYTIEEGDYLFTLMNVINKRFKVEKGGTIKWTGDPYNAKLDINAIYKLRTSLHDLGQQIAVDTTRKRVPVNVMLNMREDLLSPEIHFDIKLPGADEFTKSQLQVLLYNEQELNQQVFALLTLNRFVPPLNVAGGAEYSQAGVTSSTELLSNQLSNWLSQISNEFDVGVNYRPGDEISSQEFEFALSTQVLNDRVILDGNVGVSNNPAAEVQQTNNMVGEFNVEYKISEDGRFRVKGFNRPIGANQIDVNSNYTQGVGLFYRVEFNTFGELYNQFRNRIRRKDKKQENDSEVEETENDGAVKL